MQTERLTTDYSYKSLLSIGVPIMMGNLAQTLIMLIDTAFLGHLSENALSASVMTGVFYYVFTTLAWGFSIGIQVMIARRLGENRLDRVGVIFGHGAMLLIPLALTLFGIMHFWADDMLKAVTHSGNIYLLAQEYIHFRYVGIIFVCFNYLFRGLYIGLSNTRPISYSTALMAAVNIFFDYVLIFGKMGFPEMGVAGAALASVLAEISALVFFLSYTLLRLPLKTYALFSLHKIEGWLMRTIVSLSLPTMFQKMFSIGVWFLFFILVEHMGERPIAITGMMRSVYMLIGIPAYALGATANTLTSRLIGEGRGIEVMSMLKKTIRLSMYCVVPIILACVLFPDQLLSIYSDDPTLIADSKKTLYVLCVGMLSLSFGVVFFEAISGRGETLNAMLLEAVVLVIYVIHIYMLSTYFRVDIAWVWTSELLYWSTLGIFSWIYLKMRKNNVSPHFKSF